MGSPIEHCVIYEHKVHKVVLERVVQILGNQLDVELYLSFVDKFVYSVRVLP